MRNLIQNTLLFFIICIPLTCKAGARTEAARYTYISKYKPYALMVELRYGIPASICLAQALLETDAGRSKLNLIGNNHFGIKAGTSWSGPTMRKIDDNYDSSGALVPSNFRVYSTAAGSFRNYGQLLSQGERYQGLFVFPKSDYKAWANGIQSMGYASNPYYAKLLIWLIERYDLDQIALIEYQTLPEYEGMLPESTKSDQATLPILAGLDKTQVKHSTELAAERAIYCLGFLFTINSLLYLLHLIYPHIDIQRQFMQGKLLFSL